MKESQGKTGNVHHYEDPCPFFSLFSIVCFFVVVLTTDIFIIQERVGLTAQRVSYFLHWRQDVLFCTNRSRWSFYILTSSTGGPTLQSSNYDRRHDVTYGNVKSKSHLTFTHKTAAPVSVVVPVGSTSRSPPQPPAWLRPSSPQHKPPSHPSPELKPLEPNKLSKAPDLTYNALLAAHKHMSMKHLGMSCHVGALKRRVQFLEIFQIHQTPTFAESL